jgi:hypothetical protein
MTKRVFKPFGEIYKVGQPIGFYSSWPAFAMSIHILVEYSAFRLGKPKVRDYTVLGDDVAVYDKSVYAEFLKQCALLGLVVNNNKRTRRTKAAEFAKRCYVRKNGKVNEITGIPVTHLKQLTKQPYICSDFVTICIDRGYKLVPLCVSVFTLISTLPINKR